MNTIHLDEMFQTLAGSEVLIAGNFYAEYTIEDDKVQLDSLYLCEKRNEQVTLHRDHNAYYISPTDYKHFYDLAEKELERQEADLLAKYLGSEFSVDDSAYENQVANELMAEVA